jgi:hypothetical protein
MAAAWLAGYKGNWRLLEDRAPYQVWRAAKPKQELSIDLVSQINVEVVPGCPGGCPDDPQILMQWMLGSLATEYLIAHWGIEAPFAFYSTPAANGEEFSMTAFGLTKEELTKRIDAYLQAELE